MCECNVCPQRLGNTDHLELELQAVVMLHGVDAAEAEVVSKVSGPRLCILYYVPRELTTLPPPIALLGFSTCLFLIVLPT